MVRRCCPEHGSIDRRGAACHPLSGGQLDDTLSAHASAVDRVSMHQRPGTKGALGVARILLDHGRISPSGFEDTGSNEDGGASAPGRDDTDVTPSSATTRSRAQRRRRRRSASPTPSTPDEVSSVSIPATALSSCPHS